MHFEIILIIFLLYINFKQIALNLKRYLLLHILVSKICSRLYNLSRNP